MMTSCAPKPISTAKNYFKALEAKDWPTARKYITESSGEDFEWMVDWEDTAHKYKVLRQEESADGQSAKVHYTVDDDPQEKYISLVKVGDKWLIDLTGGK